MKKITIFTLIIAVMISVSVAQEEDSNSDNSGLSIYQLLDLFSVALQTVRVQYVETVDESDLIMGAVQGMLVSLDPHSGYLSPDQMDRSEVQRLGEFGGLGIEVTMERGWVKVVSPIDDTPAAKAGVQAGDFITKINGETVLGMTLDEAVKLMRGPVGSDIVITIERQGEEDPLEITITRAVISIESAAIRREADALVVRIKTFSNKTLEDVTDGIAEQVEESGGWDSFTGVVLDLRNNPGGLLNSAIEVTDAFLDQGDIVSVRGRDLDRTQNYTATEGDLTEGKPIAVLINGGSASASEIVAGALQDHNRAVVVGTKSFGKGSVQTIFNLGEDKGGVRLTTARYYTPSGRSIQGKGINPDIQVNGVSIQPSQDTDEESRQFSESDLPGSLENDSILNSDLDEEEAIQDQIVMQELRQEDPQMAHAIDMLSAISVLNRF